MRKLREAKKNRVMTSAEYSNYGLVCPGCKGHRVDLKPQRFDCQNQRGILPVSCISCGAAWDMRYVLDGYEWEGVDATFNIED